MSFRNPRPPAPSGWVGTIDRSSPAMRFSSTKTRARRQSQAARRTREDGAAHVQEPPASEPEPAGFPARRPLRLVPRLRSDGDGLQDRPGDHEHGDQHPGKGPVAQAGDASDDADEGPPLRGRDHPRTQEVGNERRAHPVRHGLAQDERRNGQQEADVHAEVHGQRLVDAARQHPARVEGPGDEGQPREQGEEHGPPNDAEAPRGDQPHAAAAAEAPRRRRGTARATDRPAGVLMTIGLRATSRCSRDPRGRRPRTS